MQITRENSVSARNQGLGIGFLNRRSLVRIQLGAPSKSTGTPTPRHINCDVFARPSASGLVQGLVGALLLEGLDLARDPEPGAEARVSAVLALAARELQARGGAK